MCLGGIMFDEIVEFVFLNSILEVTNEE